MYVFFVFIRIQNHTSEYFLLFSPRFFLKCFIPKSFDFFFKFFNFTDIRGFFSLQSVDFFFQVRLFFLFVFQSKF